MLDRQVLAAQLDDVSHRSFFLSAAGLLGPFFIHHHLRSAPIAAPPEMTFSVKFGRPT
jgi:hypothetical protein